MQLSRRCELAIISSRTADLRDRLTQVMMHSKIATEAVQPARAVTAATAVNRLDATHHILTYAYLISYP